MGSNFTELIAKYKNPALWTGLLDDDKFDPFEKLAWIRHNWQWSIYGSIIYVILVHLGQKLMANRDPFDLRIPLAIWNFSLAIFSFKGATVFMSQFYELLVTQGHHAVVCGTLDMASKQSTYWGCLFVISKMIELGDTGFIILRKRQLIFLHIYHHLTVLICVWISARDLMSTGGIFALFNYTVHALMYTYFGLTTIGIKVPKLLAMSLTAAQFLQMIVGLLVNCIALQKKLMGEDCPVTNFHICLVFGMYFSYAVLFGQFFYDTYMVGKKAIFVVFVPIL